MLRQLGLVLRCYVATLLNVTTVLWCCADTLPASTCYSYVNTLAPLCYLRRDLHKGVSPHM